jgi:hypothetical protein
MDFLITNKYAYKDLCPYINLALDFEAIAPSAFNVENKLSQ